MTLRSKLELAVGLLFVLVIGTLGVIVHHYHRQSIDNGFRADSLAAVTDSVRKVGDAWQRRVVQMSLTQDSLEKALKLKPTVITSTVIQFDTVRVHDNSAVVASDSTDSVRTAHFEEYTAPVHTVVDVGLPRAPQRGALALLTTIDPIAISLRLECGEPVGGIRPAVVTATTSVPRMHLGLPTLQADKAVCNPAPSLVLSGWKLPGWTVPAAGGVGLLLGLLLHH